ncbi:hypothetical protein F5Y03DRAFT_390138 [Xylaria venustula]|nr:hypothetical protein F5Y03DRAFT_390138 [Xylaria venustula]
MRPGGYEVEAAATILKIFARSPHDKLLPELLGVFDISKGIDERDLESEQAINTVPGIVNRVESFKATFKPRNSQHETLIRQFEELCPWEQSNTGELEHNFT